MPDAKFCRSFVWPAVCSALCATPAMAWDFDASLSYESDDNVTLAEFDQDIEEDTRLGLSVGVSHKVWESGPRGLLFSGEVGVNRFSDFDGLDNDFVKAGLTWTSEKKDSPMSPLNRLRLQWMGQNVQTDIRDGSEISLEAGTNLLVMPRVIADLAVRYDSREAETEVFDLDNISLITELGYEASAKLSFFIGYQYKTGDLVSTATPTLRIINASDALEIDNAFSTPGDQKLAYRLDADSHIFKLSLDYKLADNQLANLSARFVSSEADAGIGYDRTLIMARYSYQFGGM